MRFYQYLIVLCCITVGCSFNSLASNNHFPYFASDIKVDGKLNEDIWQHAAVLQLKNVTDPFENTPSPVATEVRFFENGDTLFVAFKAQDHDTSQLRAFFHPRDRAARDDLVGIRLDPYGDHRIVFQFFVNPLGVQMDSTEDVVAMTESLSWDAIWDSAAVVTEQGYQVEMAIPLRSINFDPENASTNWAVEFIRLYPREENYRLSHIRIDRDNECLSCQMPAFTGFKRYEKSKSLQLTPTLVANHQESRNLFSNSNWESQTDYEVGLDVKWGISSDIFLNATFNPDFSQVEADDAQININDNFTLTIEEKRPFFLENQDIFNTDYDLVYTRNISSPDVGAKVTGRTGKHAFGLFVTDDESTTFFVPGNLGSSIAQLDTSSNNAALRYRYDSSENFHIGFLGTARTADDYHNYVGSTDLLYKLTPQDIFRGQIIYSNTEYPQDLSQQFCNGDSQEDCLSETDCQFDNCDINEAFLRTVGEGDFEGHALRLRYNHEERDWFANTRYQEISDGFRSDLGNQVRVDQNRIVAQAGVYYWGTEDSWWNKITAWIDWDILRNDDRDVLEREWEYAFEIFGSRQSYFYLVFISRDEVGSRLDESNLTVKDNTSRFNIERWESYFEIQLTSKIFVSADIFLGDRIDFNNNREGTQRRFVPNIEYNVSDHLTASLNYDWNHLKADGAEVFTANVADLRINYNFDLRHALKFSLIHTRIDQNLANQPALLPENLPNSQRTELSTQLIYSYQLNPQSVIFAGYSDSALENDRIASVRRNSYNVFMKFSYAWLY